LLRACFLLGTLLFCAFGHADAPSDEPTIILNRFIVGPMAAYSVRVFPDGTVRFYGLNTRTPRTHQVTVISQEKYRQALNVLDEVDLSSLTLEPQDPNYAVARVTVVRNGTSRSVPFRTVSPAFAKVIRSLEERLQLRDFICPRKEWLDGKMVDDGCPFEDRHLDALLSGTK
jgi:hypothetical protein